MKEIPGLLDSFKKAKIIFLTTYSETGEEHSRKMTNLNEDPSTSMWFPTYINTKKVTEIEKNPKALITFPAEKKGEFFEIEGKAQVETGEQVEKKWFWWYLYWRPSQRNRFWFPSGNKHPDWAIINFIPVKTSLIKKNK
jgi:general stress protein 26